MTVHVLDTIDLSRFGKLAASSIDVGIFAGARYETGELVADVAAKTSSAMAAFRRARSSATPSALLQTIWDRRSQTRWGMT